MSQIAKRTKKGHQSKADLAQRDAADEEPELPKLRRSLRRRNLRYNLDFAHYLDEDDDDEEEDERLEKKLKLVVKLPPYLEDVEDGGSSGFESRARKETSVAHAPLKRTLSSSRSVCSNPLKKRRISGCDVVDGDPDCDCTDEETQREEDSAGANPISATASDRDHSSGSPLPDKNSLELILDKLQKKDVYGVFAEPVDPEELPDYHDIIELPMDFSTVRKKLDGGSYLTLEQFESDVFLICSNAMQYNAPDTIYHKQARSMQDLATRRFEVLRIEMRRRDKERTSEDKPKSKPKNNTLEHLSSDFSSGATLTAPDVQNMSMVNISSERTSRVELPVENRRLMYMKPVVGTLSMMDKELIPVGLHLEHSYAKSLARFAATLGPVAWKTAKNKIQRGLPSGVEFGRGWVGQHEPLPKSSLSTLATDHPSNSQTTHSFLKAESKESGQCPNSASRIVPSVQISADSLYNSAREGFQDPSDQKARCFPTNGRPLHLSWFHKKKPEMLPPDLNIGFQSSGSLDTSGISIESSHPDLALQL